MKKFIGIIGGAFLAMSLTACGGGGYVEYDEYDDPDPICVTDDYTRVQDSFCNAGIPGYTTVWVAEDDDYKMGKKVSKSKVSTSKPSPRPSSRATASRPGSAPTAQSRPGGASTTKVVKPGGGTATKKAGKP